MRCSSKRPEPAHSRQRKRNTWPVPPHSGQAPNTGTPTGIVQPENASAGESTTFRPLGLGHIPAGEVTEITLAEGVERRPSLFGIAEQRDGLGRNRPAGRLVPNQHFRDAPRLAEVAVVRASAVGARQDRVRFVDLLESGCANRSNDIPVHAPGKIVVGSADSRGRFVAGNAEDDVITLRRHSVVSRLNYTRIEIIAELEHNTDAGGRQMLSQFTGYGRRAAPTSPVDPSAEQPVATDFPDEA